MMTTIENATASRRQLNKKIYCNHCDRHQRRRHAIRRRATRTLRRRSTAGRCLTGRCRRCRWRLWIDNTSLIVVATHQTIVALIVVLARTIERAGVAHDARIELAAIGVDNALQTFEAARASVARTRFGGDEARAGVGCRRRRRLHRKRRALVFDARAAAIAHKRLVTTATLVDKTHI
jgi:hypothetical protein